MTVFRLAPACKPLACLAALLLLPLAAHAQQASSVYSTFNLKKCAVISKDADTGDIVQRCKGSGGFEFFIADGDLRTYVGYGPNGLDQKAFTQTLSPFNSVNDTVEFRVRGTGSAPFAAILRYRTADEDGKERGQVLVVTKIDGKEACHMAYIDARANPAANALARDTADSMAPGFDCARDEPKVVGAKGVSRM
jgi:hypothetical protein